MGKVLVNEFSWSKSRHEKFSECRRAYYLHYYAAWGGWDRSAPATAKEAYVLKRLGNRFTWGGSVVHEHVRDVLQAVQQGQGWSAEVVEQKAHRVMQDDYKASKAKRYRHGKIRGQFNGLVEHEYDEPLPDSTWKQNWENVKQALRWFAGSRWPGVAQALPADAWLEVDTTDFDRSYFTLEGVRVFAVPDFAFREGAAAHIVDWKTGRPRDGYDEQVVGYALYLHQRYGIPLEGMKATLVYLNAGVEKTFEVQPAAVTAFEARFRDSVSGMRALLRDPGQNAPKAMSEFPMTDDLSACEQCPFRRICDRVEAARQAQQQAAAAPDPG